VHSQRERIESVVIILVGLLIIFSGNPISRVEHKAPATAVHSIVQSKPQQIRAVSQGCIEHDQSALIHTPEGSSVGNAHLVRYDPPCYLAYADIVRVYMDGYPTGEGSFGDFFTADTQEQFDFGTIDTMRFCVVVKIVVERNFSHLASAIAYHINSSDLSCIESRFVPQGVGRG